MKKIIVAVGSKRGPKLQAVREALASLGDLLSKDAQFEVEGFDVPSGVRHTPLSRAELMAGARSRALGLLRIAREKAKPWKYFVGLEGGFDVIREGDRRWVFLESWAYVCDATAEESFGQSGGILVPEALARRVVDDGVELADAIDSFAGKIGVRDGPGAWGVFSRGLVTRQEAFRIALVNAFAPFFNREAYSARASGARA